ncbi:hypothetical protein [Alkalihalobacterium chitinilyticum]|uniref:Phage gp6-like head-tail connector protein n=1 Tax=Alkalihalobacterium chitinilyticum TaxID=2980103 RepID=A0ABT5VJN8_9BACI|nr:hypothetical protein [Alkalihalobacterium chitinilyticum]MDE5415485.1 hypothetical protein [Alkalihalobacterium chitinilyticum]
MNSYATLEDLKEYLELTDADFPSDINRLLLRASEFLDYATKNRLREGEVARQAACAQVEFWLTLDESTDILGNIKSFNISKFSLDYGSNGLPTLAPRARRILARVGLLYRGVGIR